MTQAPFRPAAGGTAAEPVPAVPAPRSRPPLIVAGFDSSDHSRHALDRAAEEAVARGGTLEILYGWPWDLLPPEPGAQGEATTLFQRSRRVVDEAADRIRQDHPDLPVVPVMTVEAAETALARRGRHAALTVVGTRGHGGFAGMLLGSVSLHVAAHTTGPLLVVRGDNARTGHRVLVAVKSDLDREALRFAFEEARRRKAELYALHVWQYPAFPEHAADAGTAEEVARFAVSALREEYPDVQVRTEPAVGPPARQLIEATRSADVVVLAAHRRRHRIGMQLGPVTHALLHHSHCPVAVIPAD
ncbi:universal stress protein [Streptomyces sp. YIM 98790]|uniref:universal stress protein n=1 Tax=Streptomyces sp. YIM 98790 TaxID=2689077 RepID=UPI00140C77B2|nr:universal stress protein [Streptomyces sp. YIM 98790]